MQTFANEATKTLPGSSSRTIPRGLQSITSNDTRGSVRLKLCGGGHAMRTASTEGEHTQSL
jgi:hypothetical protein